MKKGYAIIVCAVMVALGIAISGCLGPSNNPPTAKISVTPQSQYVKVGETVTFDGSKSSDDKGINKYEWDFGDGAKLEGKTVTHNYTSSGKFTAKLTVTDTDGATGSVTTTITVSSPGARVVVDAYPPNVLVNDPVTLDASRSQNTSSIVSYFWDFGDSQTTNGTVSKVTHAYNATGTKQVTLFAEYSDKVIGSYSVSVGVFKPDTGIKNGSTFVTSTFGDPERLDPAVDYESAGGEILQNVYETLITYDGTRADKFVPQLLVKMPELSADGKEYTMTLRQGVQFASGREMKADDAVFSLQRVVTLADPSGPSWMVEQVTTNYAAQYVDQPFQNWIDDTDGWNAGQALPQYLIDSLGSKPKTENLTSADIAKVAGVAFFKVSDYVFKIKLSRAYPAFIPVLAYTIADILDSQLVKDKCGAAVEVHKTCDYMDKNAVAGTGPFVVNEGKWEANSKITMDPNANWWRAKQQGYKLYVTKVIIRFDPEYNTRLQLLKNGDADFAAIGWTNKADVEGNADLRIDSGRATFVINFYGMNEKISNTTGMDIPKDFFKDKSIRKAFAYAWPYDDFIKNVMNGGGFHPQGPIPKGMFGWRDDPAKMYKYDPAESEKLFRAAGWWDKGFTISLLYNTGNDARQKGCELFKSTLEKMNDKFHVNVQGLDWPTYLDKNKKGELPLFFLGWAPDYADPDDYVVPFLHSVRGYYAVKAGYVNTALDKLIDDAGVELDTAKRAQLYSQIQDLDFEDSPHIWNLQSTTYHVERTWVGGYYYNPMYSGGTYWAYIKAKQ